MDVCVLTSSHWNMHICLLSSLRLSTWNIKLIWINYDKSVFSLPDVVVWDDAPVWCWCAGQKVKLLAMFALLQTGSAGVLQEHGVKDDELQSILNYLLTMHEVGMQTPHRCKHFRPPDGATAQLLLSNTLMSWCRRKSASWRLKQNIYFFPDSLTKWVRRVGYVDSEDLGMYVFKLKNVTMCSNGAVLMPFTFVFFNHVKICK